MTFAEFWPEYVQAHSKPVMRVGHCVGTILGWMLLGGALEVHRWRWIAAALVVSSATLWLSHFLVERHKPATFEHLRWSWWADQMMVFLMLRGQMGKEVQKYTASEFPRKIGRNGGEADAKKYDNETFRKWWKESGQERPPKSMKEQP